MRISAQSPLQWEAINKAVQQELGIGSNVYVYRGLHQALFETSLGLHLKFGHKRKIVAETGFGDHLKKTEVELARLGVRFKDAFEEPMVEEEKKTLLYIHDLDDALTASLYDHIETLKALTSTKISRLHVAHHLFNIRKSFVKNLSEFDIMACALNQDYAVVFTGEKVKLPQLTVAQLAWDLEIDGPKILGLLQQEPKLHQSEIIAFETALPKGLKPWFPKQPAKRIYDRAVIIVEGGDGSALMELLAEELQLPVGRPGHHLSLEAPSYCRWENEAWFQQADGLGVSQDDLRGTLLISGELLINPSFKKAFTSALGKFQSLSTP